MASSLWWANLSYPGLVQIPGRGGLDRGRGLTVLKWPIGGVEPGGE